MLVRVYICTLQFSGSELQLMACMGLRLSKAECTLSHGASSVQQRRGEACLARLLEPLRDVRQLAARAKAPPDPR